MIPEFICDKRVTGRKHHQCFHCYRSIAPGETHSASTLKFDGRVYTLRFHDDCQACWDQYCKDAGLRSYDFDDGYPPLHDDWSDGGEMQHLCDQYRGLFPHVITRLEHNMSDAEDRYAARLAELRRPHHDH